MSVDIIIIIAYMIGINIIGLRYSRVRSMNDYYLGGSKTPWLLSSLSIVATETSALTFISIPGLAYAKGVGFLQVAAGYLLGRILVAFILLPKYFDGNYSTAYEYLQTRFGAPVRKTTAVIFQFTRLVAESVRLFATGIPLTVLTGLDYRLSILVIGAATFIYTYYGGIKSVIITDSIQLLVYLSSAFAGIYFITHITGSSFFDIFSAIPADYLNLFSTGNGAVFSNYNIFSGLIGGAFLSFASHGTDQLMVQRLLVCRNLRDAQKAIILSGVIIIIQFSIFLLFGLFIRVLLEGKLFVTPDEIMPFFMVNYLPEGLRGIMLAGIFASTMSSLSSSINSLASSTSHDIMNLTARYDSESRRLKVSRIISLVWTILLVGIACMFQNTRSPLVEIGLGIASVTYGGMLSIFMQGRFFKKFSDSAAITGLVAGTAAIAAISVFMNVFWPWYVPAGFAVSFLSGAAINYIIDKKSVV